MAQLFQAARLNVSMDKTRQQFAEGKKVLHIPAKKKKIWKNKLLCAAGEEADNAGHDERLNLFCMQTHAFIPACMCALSVMTNALNANVTSTIPFSESSPWRQHGLPFRPWQQLLYLYSTNLVNLDRSTCCTCRQVNAPELNSKYSHFCQYWHCGTSLVFSDVPLKSQKTHRFYVLFFKCKHWQ